MSKNTYIHMRVTHEEAIVLELRDYNNKVVRRIASRLLALSPEFKQSYIQDAVWRFVRSGDPTACRQLWNEFNLPRSAIVSICALNAIESRLAALSTLLDEMGVPV